jgi:hypothetical protein
MNEPWKHMLSRLKGIYEGHIVYDSIYMKCPVQENQ